MCGVSIEVEIGKSVQDIRLYSLIARKKIYILDVQVYDKLQSWGLDRGAQHYHATQNTL